MTGYPGNEVGAGSVGAGRAVTDRDVEVRRSTRRRRTVSARREGNRLVVMIPAAFTAAEEREWVARMLARVERGERRRRPGDAELARRAATLSRTYLGGLAHPVTVRWVDNQVHRWGSCSPASGEIRVSRVVRGMPPHVVDYVVLHELAHLLVAGHGPDFWALLAGYPHLERARGFLDGVTYATGTERSDADDTDTTTDGDGGSAQ